MAEPTRFYSEWRLLLCKHDWHSWPRSYLSLNTNGVELICLASASYLSQTGITDIVMEKRLELQRKLLLHQIFGQEDQLEGDSLWQHRSPPKTIEFLREYEVLLAEEIILEKEISLCELILYCAKDLTEVMCPRIAAATFMFLEDLRRIRGCSRKDSLASGSILGPWKKKPAANAISYWVVFNVEQTGAKKCC